MRNLLSLPVLLIVVLFRQILPAAVIGVALGEFLIAPIAAQSLPSPQYPITYVANDVIGDGSLPNGGTPSGYANRPPAFPETMDVTPWISPDGINYTSLAGQNGSQDEAKARFTCSDGFIGVFDPIRGPGVIPYGHGHNYFGNKNTTKDSDYTSLRQNPDSTCGGGMGNGSAYWHQWVYKESVFYPGKNLVKIWDIMNLYYVTAGCYAPAATAGPDYTSVNFCQPLPRGFKTVFGFNMDDNWQAFKTLVANWSAAHPELGSMQVVDTAGTWKCETSNGSYSGSPWPGNASQPYLANADGTETLRCPVNEQIINSIESPQCWDGRLSSPDGFSNLRPFVLMSDGKFHCPNHWYRLPSIKVFLRYSHQGAADYRTWKCSSDPAGSVAAGFTVKPCQTSHTDYIFGWNESISNIWQCNIGIQVPGMSNCTPGEMDFNTISPTQRLISTENRPNGNGPIVSLDNKFTGAKVSDWFTPTPAQQGPFQGHAGMPH